MPLEHALQRQRPARSSGAKKPMPERLGLSVEEAGASIGLGRTASYKAAASGELPTIRMGRRLIVPVPALRRLLEMRGMLPSDVAE
jgi:hypothetical protein